MAHASPSGEEPRQLALDKEIPVVLHEIIMTAAFWTLPSRRISVVQHWAHASNPGNARAMSCHLLLGVMF